MRLSGTKTSTISTSRGLGNQLYDLAGERPSLDLQFSDQKSLVDAATGSQPVTFTRASSGTYVDSQGVIRTATTNLLLRSEEFTLSPWTLFGTASRAADVTTAPNGTLTADSVILPVNSGIFSSTAGSANTTYTFSIWIRCDSTQSVRILINTNLNDPTTKTVTATTVWQRFDVTKTTSVGTTSWTAQVDTGGGNTFYLWGAQLEQSSTVGEYIPTTSTINSAPRFDHNPTTGESLGLLVEEQRTNLVRNNTMVGAVAGSPGTAPTNGWVITNNATYTSSIIGTGIENGINYIDVQYVIAAGAAASGGIVYADTPAAIASTVYTGSYYLKLVSGSSPQIRFVWQDGANTVNRTFFDLTTILTRYTDTVTTSVGATLARFALSFAASPSGATFVIRIGLPQVEQGAFATSVIPTTTAAVTRSADVASITGSNFSSWYRQDEGTVFQSFVPFSFGGSATNQTSVAFTDGTSSNLIGLTGGGGASTREHLFMRVRVSASDIVGTAFSPLMLNLPDNTLAKCSFAFAANNYGGSCNGDTPVQVSSGALPSGINTMSIMFGFNALNGYVRRLTYWPQRLPNSTLQQITQ